MTSGALRYRAFLSYSHRDSRVAARLHRRLESYRIPPRLRDGAGREGLPSRIRPVFRDRDELATASRLNSSIETALSASAALIVVCSPAAVASRWVNEEIRYFRRHHPDRPVLAFVVDGDPAADPRRHPENAALPLNLILDDVDDPQGARIEPLAADARPEGDGFQGALLKLVAGLIGVGYDRLRQREVKRRQRRWALAGSASLLLTGVFAYLAWSATLARDQARRAQAAAELELISERQTRAFLLSVFELANPNAARGEKVTVREVLDEAVRRIESTEFERPVIKSRFLATMGRAYASLGLNQRSTELLKQSLESLPAADRSPQSQTQRIDSLIDLADVYFDMGDYTAATNALSLASGTGHPGMSADQRGRIANIRGDVLAYTERDDAAMAAYREALRIADDARLPREQDVSLRSRSLGGMAVLHHFAGDFETSVRLFQQAVDLLIPVYGIRHPDSIWAVTSLGSAAYSNGDFLAAREAWSRALRTARQVLGEQNPEVGTIKNNLARLLLESGELEQAESLLRDALEIDSQHRVEQFGDLVYPLNNLALVRAARGDRDEAVSLLEEALPIARSNHHRWLGPVLNNIADLYCREGRIREGLEHASEAHALTVTEHGVDDWRSHRAALTLGYCHALSGQSVDEAVLESHADAIVDHWGESVLYAERASAQLRTIRERRGQTPVRHAASDPAGARP